MQGATIWTRMYICWKQKGCIKKELQKKELQDLQKELHVLQIKELQEEL